MVNIFWFRQDLRLSDNPGLVEAVKSGKVLAIYILEDEDAGEFKMGGASRWWLHHSLGRLNESLGGKLNVYEGKAKDVILRVVEEHGIKSVYWNRCYEDWRIKRDKDIKEALRKKGVEAESFNGSLLWEPWEVLKSDKTFYKVFTPFYRNGCLKAKKPREVIVKPKKMELVIDKKSLKIEQLGLLPKIHWYEGMEEIWEVGEEGAKKRLKRFLKEGLEGYKEGRNYPNNEHVSRLSAHLHFGEISINEVWHRAKEIEGLASDVDCFLSELAWREFSYYLLYHFPELPKKNFQKKFDNFSWEYDEEFLKAWKTGKTGYPIVDAGMRELWETGYMHNRVRMIVGSFLVKNLLLDWREGARWFLDCLVDADLASNSFGWQWVAGSGADAAPYFRIFNPVLQGEKFDSEGEYTRRFVPELSKLPKKYLFKPWEAPEAVLKAAGVILGETYPKPIVNLERSRNRALRAYDHL